MKKKVLFAASVLCIAMLAAGCGEKKEEVKTDYVDDLSKYITLGEYKGLEYEEASVEVTDDEIESEIQYLAEAYAEQEQITEGTVADGDTVNIDFVGYLDGEAFDGGTGAGYDLTIGSGAFIPGFEEALIGMNVGETRSIDVTFPDPYSVNPDMSGAAVVFDVTANYLLGEAVVPEITDAFIAEYTDYDTVEAYREYLRGELEEYKISQAESTKEQELWQMVMDNCEIIELPEDKVTEETESMYASYEEYVVYYGMEMSDFLDQMGMTEEDFRAEMTTYAEELVGRYLAFYSIVEAEDIMVSDEEYAEEAALMAEEYGYESVEAMEEAAGADIIREDILWKKVMDVITGNANVK